MSGKQAESPERAAQPSAPSWSDPSSCPVPHAKSQPLPPGHPPIPEAPASTLFPPTDSRCIFYRSPDDLAQTPPLSRTGSSAMLSSASHASSLLEMAVSHSAAVDEFDRAQKLDQARKEANVNPMPADRDSQLGLDPNCTLVLASRNSQLALVQSSYVSALLEARYGLSSPLFAEKAVDALDITGQPAKQLQKVGDEHTQDDLTHLQTFLETLHVHPGTPLRPHMFPITSMSTAGDQNLRSPLYVIGGEGKAIWTKELEVALEQGGVDAIVHCLKDIPTALPKGLELAAVLEREDPRDAFVVKKGLPYKVLDELPVGSVIGTSSVRRVAQLRRRYPHLVFSDVRGNINTRLAKLDAPTGPYTALILAAAGLIRLNMHARITAFLSSPVLLYSVGQGSLAIEVRTPPKGATPSNNRDARIKSMIQSISDWRSTFRAEAERALLRELEGGCSIPVGVESKFIDHDQVEGQRNEAVALVDDFVTQGDSSAKAELPNGGNVLIKEGHTIPASQLAPEDVDRMSSNKRLIHTPVRPSLESLSTDREMIEAAQARHHRTNSIQSAETLAQKITSTSISIVDRSTPAPEGQVLHMDAIVVSLDGARESKSSGSRHCKTIEDARSLGIEIAHDLAHQKGARAILDEVEKHRKMAEEADRRRREAARLRKATGLSGAEPRPEPSAFGKATAVERGDLTALRNGNESWMRGQTPIDFAAEVERMRHGAPANGQGDPLELDRRFMPRDDGQPKAWEV